MNEGERRLAVIMFTDLVGYTSLSQKNEALAVELLGEHRELMRPFFPKHGGREVKTIGDSFLVEFASALEAVRCAVEMQQSLHEHNSNRPADRSLGARVGIHLGDVIHSESDVYGDAVNVASRIEPLADAGGVCISQQVYDSIRNKTDLTLTGLGKRELKNVELPLAVYKISMPWEEPTRKSQAGPRERLAVLPFVNISPDPNDEFFADGLTEEMIAKLSDVRGLKVIARTSVMNYKKKEKNISDIGKELGVGTIVEGSVRKAGNKIRVTVQLIDAGTEEHLWASNYDKELDDIFAIQSDIAINVASSLSKKFFSTKAQKDTDDVEAYTFYIRAMQLYHERTEGSLREALELLTKAVSRDPGFVRAHAGMALTWTLMAFRGFENFSVITEKGELAAKKALELGPEVAEAHAAMAQICWSQDRFEESVAEAKKAVELNPNLADSYYEMGSALAAINLREAVIAQEKAYELDPLSLRVMDQLAELYRSAGRFDDATRVLRRMLQLNPRDRRTYEAFFGHYLWVGDYPKAQEMMDKALEMGMPEPTTKAYQGVLYALMGRRKEAEGVLDLFNAEKKESVRLYGQLHLNAALGNMDAAFDSLMREAVIHSWPYLIKYTPLFADMRKDPRFNEFCKAVGIPP